jgi:predicted nuclease with RNAse H fold
MAILVGVQPGGKGNFAVTALYWSGKLPAIVFRARSYFGVDEVLADIMGTTGEWGSLTMVAIAAPLSWSGTPSGWRRCDRAMVKGLPAWAPKTWLRAPNSLPGAVSVQGPALTWAMAKEAKLGQLPEHGVVETHPRVCLSHIASDLQAAVLDYRRRDISAEARQGHVEALLKRLTEPGMLRIDADSPRGPDELDALVCAMVALGVAVPDSGLVIQEHAGGDIRPVGKRSVMLLTAFP